MSSADKQTLNPTLEFAAGTVAGMSSLFVGHPLDTIKVRLQSSQASGKYTGTLNAFKTILKEERVRGLYKGVTSPLAGTAFLNGIVFASYGFFIRAQQRSGQSPDKDPSLTQIGLAGAGSGVVASIITTPTELVKIRQQMMLSPTGFPSTYQVALTIFRTEGVRGFFRGITSTCLRDLGYGWYFATYEGTCRLFRWWRTRRKERDYLSEPHPCKVLMDSSDPVPSHHVNHASLIEEMESFESELSWAELMAAGGLAGIMGWLSTFPLDPIKSRIQETRWVSPSSPKFKPSDHPYNNTLMATRSIYKQLGWKGMWAGLAPTLIRAVPTNMVTFLVFEMITGAARGN
ncbi:hypothetical protein FRB90_006420 [Tulasnella sp. 427]|nr:hypothetical protein FRB90_006420 [Tulasnella sp. 427]